MTGIKIAAAVSTAGFLASAATNGDAWTRLAIEAPLVAVIAVLLLRTFPQMNDDHRKTVEKLNEDIDRLAEEFKESNERMIRMLERELHPVDRPEKGGEP